jgi:hypothetical protein
MVNMDWTGAARVVRTVSIRNIARMLSEYIFSQIAHKSIHLAENHEKGI